jgi:Cu(I)/Ag(I) efflux system membrane protein CusA/SilA
MVVAAVLAITLDPALRLLVMRFGRSRRRRRTPISRVLIRALRTGRGVGAAPYRLVWPRACALMLATVPVSCGSGPSSCRRSTKARSSTCRRRCRASRSATRRRCCRRPIAAIKQFPEVDRVLGKAGRAETATDPAPLSMLETVDHAQAAGRVAHGAPLVLGWAPEWLQPVPRA